jgi:hypothetical protein
VGGNVPFAGTWVHIVMTPDPRSRVVCATLCPLGESTTVPARGCVDNEVGVE